MLSNPNDLGCKRNAAHGGSDWRPRQRAQRTPAGRGGPWHQGAVPGAQERTPARVSSPLNLPPHPGQGQRGSPGAGHHLGGGPAGHVRRCGGAVGGLGRRGAVRRPRVLAGEVCDTALCFGVTQLCVTPELPHRADRIQPINRYQAPFFFKKTT